MSAQPDVIQRNTPAAASLALGALLGFSSLPAHAQPDHSPRSKAAPAATLEGSAWLLESIPGQRAVLPPAPTLRLEAGRISGSDGCNRYSAPVQVKGSSFRVNQPGPSTLMACPPRQRRQAETFRAVLGSARRYRLRNGRLELLTTGGRPVARFRPQPQEIAGSVWIVTGFNNGRQAVVSTLAGSTLSLELKSRGRLTGTAGCNRYAAAVQLGEGTLKVKPPVATRRICSQPRGVMEQEVQFLSALESAGQWRIEAERLELRRPDGALAVTLRRAGTP
ncbi:MULTISPECIES: META domain-containing protein [unclassified Synechococcus]|uniref:META domain-containing protein n=1 Tax=Synechococcales TaxID=1890424 RepID=UPI001624A1F7